MRLVAATTALIALAFAAPRAAVAAGPTTLPAADADRLRAALPAVTSADPAVKSIHVRARGAAGKFDILLEAWYQAPDAYAVRFADGTDGAPLVAASAGRGVLVYDALDQYVLLIPAANPNFDLHGEGHEFKLNVGVDIPLGSGGKPKPPLVNVDLRSLFPTDGGRAAAEDLGGGARRLTHTSDKGNRMSAVVRPDGTVTDIAMVDKDGKAQFQVEAFEVDAPIPAAAFDLPSREAMAAAGLKVADAGPGLTAVGGMIKTMMKDLAVRAGARSPAMREVFQAAVPANTDWARVATEDAKASAALRDLLAVPPAGGGPAARPASPGSSATP